MEHQIPGAALFYLTTGGPVPLLPGNHRIHGSSFPLERLPVVRAEHCRPERQSRALLIEWQGQGRGLEDALSAS